MKSSLQITTDINALNKQRQQAREDAERLDAELKSKIEALGEIRRPLHTLLGKRSLAKTQLENAGYVLRRCLKNAKDAEDFILKALSDETRHDHCRGNDSWALFVGWQNDRVTLMLFNQMLTEKIQVFIKGLEDSLPGIEAEAKAYAAQHGLEHELPDDLAGRTPPPPPEPPKPIPPVPTPARGTTKYPSSSVVPVDTPPANSLAGDFRVG